MAGIYSGIILLLLCSTLPTAPFRAIQNLFPAPFPFFRHDIGLLHVLQ
ncbi:hypothetical protein F385_1433 [Pantoea agglomerans 299R]|nr:hypothetical protein F385_1433 [Pantoea agglomerans 299R]